MIRCNDCGADHLLGSLFCLECGQTLVGMGSEPTFNLGITSPFAKPNPSLAKLNVKRAERTYKHIVFFIPSSGRQVKLGLHSEIQIGRSDPTRDYKPRLDLTADSRSEHGVSRSHALVQLAKNGIVVIDLNSTNGTLLNRNKMTPEVPYPLKNGDELHLGHLLIRIFLQA